MDALITLLLVAGVVAIFVAMVRRTNAKGRDIAARHAAGLATPQRKAKPPKPPKVVTPKPVLTRAIRTGWRVGVVTFTYEDSAGDISHRTVTVHSASALYLKGECHDRQAERTFRVDRIIGDLTDCETGEILSPKQWVRSIS